MVSHFLLVPLLIFITWTTIHYIFRKPVRAKLPPGPYPLPIIGNLLELGKKPHHSLAELTKTYGPVMTLKLGTITTIVVSSSDTAKQVLQQHDHTFSNRTIPDTVRATDHHKSSIVFLPASTRWRNFRKICSTEMFTVHRLDAGQSLRRRKVQELMDHVLESCKSGQAVDIGQASFTTTLNLISNTFFSIDLAHYHSTSSQEFKDLVCGMMELAGKPNNIADFFPILRFLDLQGARGKMTAYLKKLFVVFDGIIVPRLQLRASTEAYSEKNDLLDALLNLPKENDYEFNINDIKHFLVDLFLAGTDTTSSTLEWALAELLHNPKTMARAQSELQKVMDKDMPIQESDIPRLPYLQAVVKETLRLHPTSPFLIPHKAGAEVEINGFTVPKDAQIFVNVWTIGRDPSIWKDPNSFVPERFLECKIDFKGRDFELIPFGSGRRICPGLPLAHRMVHLMLASILHSFDWKLEKGMTPEEMDMSDKYGLSIHKAEPLRAFPMKA